MLISEAFDMYRDNTKNITQSNKISIDEMLIIC